MKPIKIARKVNSRVEEMLREATLRRERQVITEGTIVELEAALAELSAEHAGIMAAQSACQLNQFPSLEAYQGRRTFLTIKKVEVEKQIRPLRAAIKRAKADEILRFQTGNFPFPSSGDPWELLACALRMFHAIQKRGAEITREEFKAMDAIREICREQSRDTYIRVEEAAEERPSET